MIKKESIFETFTLNKDVDGLDFLEYLIEQANIQSPPFVDPIFRDIRKIIQKLRGEKK